MAHFSENSHRLAIRHPKVSDHQELLALVSETNEVVTLRLPAFSSPDLFDKPLEGIEKLVSDVAESLGPQATLVIIGEIIDLVKVLESLSEEVRYQHWIAVRRAIPFQIDDRHIPHGHFGLLVLTRYKQSLQHTKTRIAYSYCPVCDRTTKDYGGKKHTYHEGGTLISDVWRDIPADLSGDLTPIINRIADLFGIDTYKELILLETCHLLTSRRKAQLSYIDFEENEAPAELISEIICSDCLTGLNQLPTGSIDFAFADPPYNLSKKYSGYSDDLAIKDYFNWCDQWITEMGRVLKPGRTLALLNIPLWAIRHFTHMESILRFQNWIVWDALAFPVRMIMPAHYTILCFTKGHPRALPGMTSDAEALRPQSAPRAFNTLKPLADDYCIRADCVEKRINGRFNDRAQLTDLWSDIHRLKHNSRRVDHPTQLPPHLMYRLISIFTNPGELVLDCFNGSGTTTLTAHQLGRRYIGIELSERYCDISKSRHKEINNGSDPFAKAQRVLTSKNSRVPRLKKQVYKIPKKTLQLEVKRVASQLGRIPSREEMMTYSEYPIEYYDDYFVSWGEVTAAARTTGMTEKKTNGDTTSSNIIVQPRLLDKGSNSDYTE